MSNPKPDTVSEMMQIMEDVGFVVCEFPDLPDFLDRKKNPSNTPNPLPPHAYRQKPNSDGIVWPKKEIERVLAAKARENKRARKARVKAKRKKARYWKG